MEKTTLQWLGHSCFVLKKGDYSAVLDPYAPGYVPGLGKLDLTADAVFVSHEHDDHNSRESVKLFSCTAKKTCPWKVTEIHSYHDEKCGKLRGTNTIRIFDDGQMKIAHMGDFGCELTPEQKDELKNIDVMMMPVGGYYTLEPPRIKKAVDELAPTVLVPMHYRSDSFGFDEIKPLEDYLKLCDDVVYYQGDTLTFPDDLKHQTAVLTLKK